MKEDEMVRWNYRFTGHEFEQTAGHSEGSLACCSPRGRKESDRAEQIQQPLLQPSSRASTKPLTEEHTRTG